MLGAGRGAILSPLLSRPPLYYNLQIPLLLCLPHGGQTLPHESAKLGGAIFAAASLLLNLFLSPPAGRQTRLMELVPWDAFWLVFLTSLDAKDPKALLIRRQESGWRGSEPCGSR